MGRILAIDYGKKRTGLAVTDSMQLIANSLDTVETPQLKDYLKKYVAREEVTDFVVGQPRRMNNDFSAVETDILKFIDEIKKIFPNIPVHRVDERFTSKLAFDAILSSGIKKMDRRDKGLVDQVSATLILQSYLEQKKFPLL